MVTACVQYSMAFLRNARRSSAVLGMGLPFFPSDFSQ